MENKVLLDLNLLKFMLESESKKLVGKLMKRFELSDDKEIIKKECKELIYESFRDINDSLINGKMLFEFKKEKE
jgi:hypothetical protein